MNKKSLLAILGVLLVPLLSTLTISQPATPESVITYTTNSITNCTGSVCAVQLYPAPVYVQENNTWLSISEASRLDDKGLWTVNIDDDGVHGFDIIAFNNSCATFMLYSLDDELFPYNNNIPIKIDDVQFARIFIRSPDDLPITRTICFQTINDNVFKHTYSFGTESTTLNLSSEYNSLTGISNSGNGCTACSSITYTDVTGTLEMGNSNTGSGRVYNGYISIDTSSVPDDATITSVDFYLEPDYETMENGEEAEVWEINYYDSLTCSAEGIATTLVGTIFTEGDPVGVWYYLPVSTDHVNKTGNTQFFINTTGSTCDINAWFSEQDIASSWPYLYIIYEAGADTCSCPGSGDWVMDCADNCNLATDCDLQGNDFRASGSGTFTLNADITNWNSALIYGGCNVHCSGGCFDQ